MAPVLIVVAIFVALYVVHTANNWLFGRAGEWLSNRNAERDRRRRQIR